MATSDSNVVYALDFDGVVCDSVGESSQTALKAAQIKWPDLPITEPFPDYMLEALRKIRPVIEIGFENILLARLVATTTADSVEDEFVNPVLKDWASIRDSVMSEWGVSKEELVKDFGSVRDGWIERDINSWLDANRMYVFNYYIHNVFIKRLFKASGR